MYQNPCPLQCYSSYFTFVLGHLVAAARRCGGGVGWPVFSLRPIHAMSPQGSPNLVLPSIVQVGGICSTYVCTRDVCTYRSADGGQLLHTVYIHSFSPTLHANSRFLSGLELETGPHQIYLFLNEEELVIILWEEQIMLRT